MKTKPVPHAALAALLVVSVSAVVLWSSGRPTQAASFATQDLTTALEPVDLVNTLLGGGIAVSNVTYAGAEDASGTFSGGSGIGGASGIGFDSGVLLSSGRAQDVVGPNNDSGLTFDQLTGGDADLDTLSGFTTEDAAVLEFDFTPQASSVTFQYVFSSEEYDEFVNSQFNDVFAFFVNGVNCATVSGPSGPLPVSINTVNNGNPFGTTPNSHPELYVQNDVASPPYDAQMDGFTVVLTCQAQVNAGQTNHMKLAIADASDGLLDSYVFLKAGSFTVPTPTPTDTPTPSNTPTSTNTPTVTTTPAATNTPTSTNTLTATNTPTATNTAGATTTAQATVSATATNTPSPTSTNTPTPTAPADTSTPASTDTATATSTATVAASATSTTIAATPTATRMSGGGSSGSRSEDQPSAPSTPTPVAPASTTPVSPPAQPASTVLASEVTPTVSIVAPDTGLPRGERPGGTHVWVWAWLAAMTGLAVLIAGITKKQRSSH